MTNSKPDDSDGEKEWFNLFYEGESNDNVDIESRTELEAIIAFFSINPKRKNIVTKSGSDKLYNLHQYSDLSDQFEQIVALSATERSALRKSTIASYNILESNASAELGSFAMKLILYKVVFAAIVIFVGVIWAIVYYAIEENRDDPDAFPIIHES